MNFIPQVLPGVNEGILKLAIPFTIVVVLLIITNYISITQMHRMPNAICVVMIVCALCTLVTKTTFLSGIDMAIGFGVSIVASFVIASIFTTRGIKTPGPFYKYFSVMGLFLGLYNVINIILFITIYATRLNFLISKSLNNPEFDTPDKNEPMAPYMLITTIITIALIVLIQLNIIPLADSVVNLYPVL
ncbi:MAG: hypothetical protein K6G88_08720 [Lachnospiraceae bacterium]|nr:hypothetical protein [Lachnospiraceae bacterium]